MTSFGRSVSVKEVKSPVNVRWKCPPPSGRAPRRPLQMAAKRLSKELDDMAQSPELLCTAGPVGDDLFVWQASLTGPPDSPYDGGRFLLELCFPPNYPHSPPKVRFATQ